MKIHNLKILEHRIWQALRKLEGKTDPEVLEEVKSDLAKVAEHVKESYQFIQHRLNEIGGKL